MIGSREAWRRMLKLLLPGLLLLVANLAILSTYRFLLAGQAQLRSARVERLNRELVGLERERSALQQLLADAERNRERVDEFYGGWISTEAQRLTRVIAEVKTLASRAGIETSSLAYPEETLEEYGLVRRSVVFSVSGSYQALRRFINFVELSEQFLILEEVRLSEAGDQRPEVRIDLRISTLFMDREDDTPDTETRESEA